MFAFRPHHFLCTLGFEGKGYSPAFVENYTQIANELRDAGGDQIMTKVVKGSDSICTACPNRQGDVCATEDKIAQLDRAHTEVHGMGPGTIISWGDAKRVVAQKMTLADHERACATCSWRSLGVCAEALKRVQKEYQPENQKACGVKQHR